MIHIFDYIQFCSRFRQHENFQKMRIFQKKIVFLYRSDFITIRTNQMLPQKSRFFVKEVLINLVETKLTLTNTILAFGIQVIIYEITKVQYNIIDQNL